MNAPEIPEEIRLQNEEARERLKKEVEIIRNRERAGNKAPVMTHDERVARLNDSQNIISLGECIQPLIVKFEEMAVKSKEFGDRLREELKGVVAPVCPEHGNEQVLDWDKTFSNSWRDRKLVPSYFPCMKCSEEIDALLVNESFKRTGVPHKLWGATLENYITDTPQKKAAFDKFIKTIQSRDFVILRGTFGTGKSHLAVAAMRENPLSIFVTMYDLIAELRKTYEDNSGQSEMVEKYRNAPTLVLDEISTEVKGVDIPALLYRILGYRHDRGLKTIITSNESLKVILDILGGRVVDRLRESYGVVTMEWESNRKRPE